MSIVRNCRMMARGDDWVKLLVDVRFDGRVPDFDSFKTEHDLLWHRLKVSHPAMGDEAGGYGRPEVMKSGLWKDRVVFKFRVKPYSDEVNDLFQYVYDFGELADKKTEGYRHRIKLPEIKIVTVEELMKKQKEKELDSEIQVVPDGTGVSLTEPGIRFGDREVRSLASRFAKHGEL